MAKYNKNRETKNGGGLPNENLPVLRYIVAEYRRKFDLRTEKHAGSLLRPKNVTISLTLPWNLFNQTKISDCIS